MTQMELNNFRNILNAKHADATRVLTRREGLRIEQTPDALDSTQFAAARELSTRNLERESTVLREVRAALDRVADGTYGTCLQCEEEISQRRLQAVPWATLCIACQQEADRNGRHSKAEERFLRAA